MLIKFIFVIVVVSYFLCSVVKANSSSGSLEFYITLNECENLNTTNVLGECTVIEGCGIYRSIKSEIEFTNNYKAKIYNNDKCSGVFTRKTIWFECVEGGSEGSDYLVFCNEYPGSNITNNNIEINAALITSTTTTSSSTLRPIFSSGDGDTSATGSQSGSTSGSSGSSGSNSYASSSTFSSSSSARPIFSSGDGDESIKAVTSTTTSRQTTSSTTTGQSITTSSSGTFSSSSSSSSGGISSGFFSSTGPNKIQIK